MPKITEPGIYYDFDETDYFADPTPGPSLTQSVAKIILDESAAHAKLAHPRLTPPAEGDDEEKYTAAKAIGNAAHKLMLGRGRDLEVLDFDNMRSGKAKDQYEEAVADGKLPVLGKHWQEATRMVEAAREQLSRCDYPDVFTDGHSEIVLAWQEAGLWFRSMIDWSADLRVVADYKTSAMCCSPYVVDTRPSEMGWDVQAAFHERGLDVLDPANAGRREHLFIAQENYAPYALSIVRISEADLTMGRKKLRMAADLWGRCLRSNTWPTYSAQTVHSRPKPWTETKTLEREIAHDERRKSGDFNPNILMAG